MRRRLAQLARKTPRSCERSSSPRWSRAILLVGLGLAAERGDIRRDIVRFGTPQAEIHLLMRPDQRKDDHVGVESEPAADNRERRCIRYFIALVRRDNVACGTYGL